MIGENDVQKYSIRKMYTFTDSDSSDDMSRFIDQCEEDGSKTPVVYLVGSGTPPQASGSAEMADFIQRTNAYFATVVSQSGNWSMDGTATGEFAGYTTRNYVKNRGTWRDNRSPGTTLPCAYVFKICSTCFPN